MDPQRWKQIDAVFHAALEREPFERTIFLAEACNEDASLRAEVEGLLASHEKGSSIFDNPAADLAAHILAKQNDYQGSIAHYEILRKIGSGGMGEVYLAEDIRLKRKVALKLLPPEFTENKDRIRRFETEARAASALNHPNILTIYDIGQLDSTSFIASEYIEGETLRQRMNSSRMLLKEILNIGIQATEALDAAHRAGIIHRDIKPENIMVRSDGYVKVLDFGLAKLTETHTSTDSSTLETLSRTDAGIVVGTIRYMSPEQARGLKVDARSDIFSIGVVLYEMISGRPPFDGSTPQDILVGILEKHPPLLQAFGNFPDELQWIITKALAKDIEERYQSTKDLLTDLKRLRKQLEISEELKRSDSSGKTQITGAFAIDTKRIAAVLGFVALSAIIFLAFYFTKKANVEEGYVIGSRPSIAVLGFKNLSGSTDSVWVSAALSEMISTELAIGEKLRVISGEEVSRSKKELSLEGSDSYSQETLTRIRKNLSADYLISGSYYVAPAGNQVRVDVHVQNTMDGKSAARFTDTRSQLDLLNIVLATGSRLRESLGIGNLNQQQTNSVRSALSSNADAVRFYSEGILRMRELDRRGARDLFLKAVKADPKFPLAFSVLSQTWLELGYTKNAQETAKKALDLSGNLSREERLLIEGRYHEANYDSESAIRSYQSLFTFFPDNLDYGLLLVRAQTDAGFVSEARKTIKTLRNLQQPLNSDPRIDLADIQVFEVYDVERNLKLAQTAAEKARLRGSALLEARALMSQGIFVGVLGQKQEGLALFERAKQIFTNYQSTGDLLVLEDYISSSLRSSGDHVAALKIEQEMLRKYLQSGERYNASASYGTIGDAYRWLGKTDEALKHYKAAQQILQELGSSVALGHAIGRMASLYSNHSDLVPAAKYCQQAIEIFQETRSYKDLQNYLGRLAYIKQRMGEKAQAREHYVQALEINRNLNNRAEIADSLVQIAFSEERHEDLLEARNYLEKLLKDFKTEKNDSGAIFALGKLESVYQAQNDIDNATRIIREKIQTVRKTRSSSIRNNELESSGWSLMELGFLREAEVIGNEITTKNKDTSLGLFLLTNVLWDLGEIQKFKKMPEEFDKRRGSGVTWIGKSHVLYMQAKQYFECGDLSQAEKLSNEVVKRSINTGDEGDHLRALLQLGQISSGRGDYKNAEALFRQAMEKRKGKSPEWYLNLQNQTLATYYLERHKFKEAEEKFHPLAEYHKSHKSPIEEKIVQAKIANCRILDGDLNKAAELLKTIDETHPQIRERFWDVIEIQQAKARLLSSQKKYSEAIQILNGVIKKAGQEGLIRLLLETNLILAKVQIQAGNRQEGSSLFQSVEKEARNYGYINIAERAAKIKKTLRSLGQDAL